jgi:GNAT superfamily N-acetyltransferase
MNVQVREYTDEDFESVSELLKNTFGYEKAKLKDDRVYEFVSVFENQVVGYFQLVETIDIIRNLKTFHVEYVCVDSNCRGKGIGHIMMEFANDWVIKHHGNRMELTSGNQRLAAHKLYMDLGFEKRDSSIFRKEIV